jgi:hypothetical protein
VLTFRSERYDIGLLIPVDIFRSAARSSPDDYLTGPCQLEATHFDAGASLAR